MDVRNLTGKCALVTGAGSGIGRSLSLEMAARGADLYLCDINQIGLEATAQEARQRGSHRVVTQRVDVAVAEEVEAFAKIVHNDIPSLDLLFNNAGVSVVADAVDMTLEDWHWQVDINLYGVIHGIHFFMPKMVHSKRGGHIINIASAAGYTPTIRLSAYCATKYGVIGLSETLRMELAKHNIGVTVICPGMIDTPIMETSRRRGATATDEGFARLKNMLKKRGFSPERCAKEILKAVGRNRGLAPVTPEAVFLNYLSRLSPSLHRKLAVFADRTFGPPRD